MDQNSGGRLIFNVLRMDAQFFPYRNSSFHYVQSGHGSVPLLAFHGYGLNTHIFSFMLLDLPPQFTLISIDLPFHGQTVWNEKDALDPALFADSLLRLLKSIPGLQLAKIHLLGYSLGGRICLSLMPLLGDQVERVTLIAGDGLHQSRFLRWIMNTDRGNRLFKKAMHDPDWLLRLLAIGTKLGMLKPRRRKFMLAYLEHPEAREKLYQRWMVLQRFQVSRNEIRVLLAKQTTALNMVFGIDDPVVRYKYGFRYVRGLEKTCKVFIIEGGHHLLHEENLPSIIPLL